MNAARPRRTPVRLALLAALAGAAASRPLHAVEAAPGAGASASPPPAAYAWPLAVTPEPAEGDWAGATDLETFVVTAPSEYASFYDVRGVVCASRALGSWVRVTCSPPPRQEGIREPFYGVIWGLSGDTTRVKGAFTLASELEAHRAPSTDRGEAAQRKMGATATVTFPITPGSALLLRLDLIAWWSGYEESAVGTMPGLLVDASWAVGEKSPTILCR